MYVRELRSVYILRKGLTKDNIFVQNLNKFNKPLHIMFTLKYNRRKQ